MKNLSILIEHKDEAIPLLEKLGYKEHTKWNEGNENWLAKKTHILTSDIGDWGFYCHDGYESCTPITIEELRELAVEPAPDKLDLLIQQMRELRAELREFMKEEKPAEAQKWKVGNRVRITKEASQQLKECEVVELIKYRKDNDICPWLAKSELGIEVWISESEAEVI